MSENNQGIMLGFTSELSIDSKEIRSLIEFDKETTEKFFKEKNDGVEFSKATCALINTFSMSITKAYIQECKIRLNKSLSRDEQTAILHEALSNFLKSFVMGGHSACEKETIDDIFFIPENEKN